MRSHVLAFLLLATAACGAPPLASAPRAGAPSKLTLRYLGVAGWQLDFDTHSLLFDPYVTRVRDAGEAPLIPDEAAIAAYTPARADVILVGHSHYDHLLDVPSIAKRTGAIVVGTESTANVARAAGLSEGGLVVARGGDAFAVGPFRVRAIAALHSLTGQENVAIAKAPVLPMPASGYAEGGTLQYLVEVDGRSVLFIGTANFIEQGLRGIHPDVAVVAVGLREKVPDYTCRLMLALGMPALVLPNHFDAFHEPLRPPTALDESTRADLDAFAAEVHGCSPKTRVVVPTPLQPMEL